MATATVVNHDRILLQKKNTLSLRKCVNAQIDSAVKIFKDKGCPFELMHTVSTYPMKDEHNQQFNSSNGEDTL